MSVVGTMPASLDHKGVSMFSVGWTDFIERKEKPSVEPWAIEISDISFETEATKKDKFLSFAGIWKDVDTERIKKEIATLRKRSARTIKGL